MANRYAPYKARYLTREPKTIVVKFTSNGADGAQTLATGPFNKGVVNVVASATGIYKIALGGSAVNRDSYTHFAGIDYTTTDAGSHVDEITNSQCNHATDPNITFVAATDGAAAYVTHTDTVWLRLHFLDSTD